MDIQAIKDKILKGEMTDEEFTKLLAAKVPHKKSGNFMKTILEGFIEGYTAPHMWRIILNAVLLFTMIIAILILSYSGKIDTMITSVLLSLILGYLLGRLNKKPPSYFVIK